MNYYVDITIIHAKLDGFYIKSHQVQYQNVRKFQKNNQLLNYFKKKCTNCHFIWIDVITRVWLSLLILLNTMLLGPWFSFPYSSKITAVRGRTLLN